MPRHNYASVEDVEQAARHWAKEVLYCRTYSHDWRPRTARHNSRDRYFTVEQVCSRCRTVRHQEMSERGHVFAQWYSYPEGYLTTGVGRIVGEARDELRIRAVKTSFTLSKSRKSAPPRSRRTRAALRKDPDA